MLYPINSIEQKLGFTQIRELLKQNCLSTLGRSIVDAMQFSTSRADIVKRLSQVREFMRLMEESDNFPRDYWFDTREYLRRITPEGTFLTESELFEIRRSLGAIAAIVTFMSVKSADDYPHLKALAERVEPSEPICRHIDTILNKFGHIKDDATSELLRIRRSKASETSAASKLLNQILASAKENAYVEKDVTPTLREGRLVIPVSPAFKRKIGGIVHDESASGKTVYIEPTQVVEANNRIRELEIEEQHEVMRILKNCSDFIRPSIPQLEKSYRFLGIIDFIQAKSRMASEIGAQCHIPSDKPLMEWYNAVHPLLLLQLKAQKKDVVPLNIKLTEENRILIISGPNAGGKSVCLKTVGLVQYMIQCGMPVIMQDGSRTGIFESIFIDIGDEQSIENDLSTYSSHLTNMKFFLKYSGERSLILIDEFGTGTEPNIGGAIAEAELEVLNSKRSYGVITTHYTNLKHLAGQTPGLVNGAMLYDRHRMEPLFQLEIGSPGSSFAIEIAKKIGLPAEIIENATRKVGAEHIDYDKNLQDAARDKRYWESKREQIRIKEKKTEETMQQLQKQLEGINAERKEILRRAREEAKELLSQTNATIENTIREIKEAKAEKERTREIRREFNEQQKELKKEDTETIRIKGVKLKYATPKSTEEGYVAGDYVKYGSSIGQVIEVKGKRLIIAIGQMEATVEADKVERASRKQFKESVKSASSTYISKETADNIRQRKLNFKSDIDVRGMRAQEAVETIAYYIDDAIIVGASQVRILHGTGTGALKQYIREYLDTVSMVRSYRDEHIQLGGAGITIVEFR
ncbi:MAG: Smr/MutS family protein [Paludibacteraceae bacterium]|nr:Smr/MutS family protein [Paludibacteraceae bacterium]